MASAPALNYSGITQELILYPACSLPSSAAETQILTRPAY